jgi:hypothetical protein
VMTKTFRRRRFWGFDIGATYSGLHGMTNLR